MTCDETPRGILIFGANGCGKTTLGRELAKRLNCRRMDVEDYYFPNLGVPGVDPYSVSRSKEEAAALMLSDIEGCSGFVLSGVTGDFGERIVSKYSLAILLSAPRELRLERIRQRAVESYGERASSGGDLYESTEKFIEFAANRPLGMIESFAETLRCPLLRLDAALPLETLISTAEKFILDTLSNSPAASYAFNQNYPGTP